MNKRKRTRKVVLKLTKQQIELAEIQYWKDGIITNKSNVKWIYNMRYQT
jgi:hypothetical protein